MGLELQLLVWAAALTVVQALIFVVGGVLQVGLPPLVGNREGVGELTGWAGRAGRAHRDMLENMVPFAALVLVGQATGAFNEMTALGAQIFFWAQLAYLVIYFGGIPWARTAVWLISVIGMVLIFAQLI